MRLEIPVGLQEKHRITSKTNCDKVMYALPPEHAKTRSPGRRAEEQRRGRLSITPWSPKKRGMWELFLTEKKGATPELRSVLWDPLPQQEWTTSIIEHTLEIR